MTCLVLHSYSKKYKLLQTYKQKIHMVHNDKKPNDLNSPIINIKNVKKIYNPNTPKSYLALDNISLEIKAGEIFALLGPNGAGKTTLIESICGLVKLSSGEITVNNLDINKDYKAVRKLIGLVPQELYLNPFTTVDYIMRYTPGYFGLKYDPVWTEKILKEFSLWEKRHSKTRQLSGGMKRRLLIARALSSKPKIIFLDEPTAGVDIELRQQLIDFVQKLKNKGLTVILTTHYLEEAEKLADRIGFIKDGKVVTIVKRTDLLKDKNSLEDMYISLVGQNNYEKST